MGKSYGEIAAEARSMHRCQAFGSEKRRGEQFEYFKALRGDQPKTDLLEGIVTDWSRFKGGELINKKIEVIIKGFKVNDPSSSVKDLLILNYQSLTETRKSKAKAVEIMKKIMSLNLGFSAEYIFDESEVKMSARSDLILYKESDVEFKRSMRIFDKKNEFGKIQFALLDGIGKIKINQTAENELIINSFKDYKI